MIEKYVDADELKKLLGSLAVFLGALMIAALFAAIVVPGLRNANKPGTPTPVSPVVGEPGWLDPAEYPPERGRMIPAVDPQTLLRPSPELMARGKQLYARNCVQCHGETGTGNGAGAANMNPPPRDFTAPGSWSNGHDVPAIYKTLSEGVKGTSMAAFDYMSRKDRMALVHYVQSLGTFSHGAGRPEEMAALSKELASPGEKTPNKIPVSMAMTRLESEYQAPGAPGAALEAAIEETQILRHIIVDEGRVARALESPYLRTADLKQLAASLVSGAPGNGFSTKIAELSLSEWKLLQNVIFKRSGLSVPKEAK